jgi:hypothetical protein
VRARAGELASARECAMVRETHRLHVPVNVFRRRASANAARFDAFNACAVVIVRCAKLCFRVPTAFSRT